MMKIRFRRKPFLLVGLFVVLIGLLSIYFWSQRVKRGEIPKEYQSLYSELEGKLVDFDQYLESLPDKENYPTIFAADLLAANGNRGKALLKEEDYPYILKYLDGLQSLGLKGVKISLNYPLLVSEFPDAERYLKFYKKLTKEIKERNLKLLIQATAMFTQAEFADTAVPTKKYYQNLTLEKYKQGKREQLEKIIFQIRPDYLTIETEPDTMAHLTGLDELNNPQVYKEVVEYQAKGLKHEGTLIGAGVGTWSRKEFVEELVKIPELDFLEFRIYPVALDFLPKALDYIKMAKAHDKKVIFGESWLYKASEAEIKEGGAGDAAVAKFFKRDTFSFWQPLDQKFLELFVKLAHYKGVEFISPFWSNYFFIYLDYSPSLENKDAGELLKIAAREAFKNIQKGKFTQTGLKYQGLIR